MNEIKAIETIDNVLGSLDADERTRVLSWTARPSRQPHLKRPQRAVKRPKQLK